MGVSKPTVSTAVQGLLDGTLVKECGLAESDGGRRPMLLDFNADAGYVVGMDIGGTTARATLANLRGDRLATLREPTETLSGVRLVSQIQRLMSALLNAVKGRKEILAVAIGTPGVVDPGSQRVRYAPNLSVLEAPGFLEQLERAVAVPVSLHNDVNLAALGEHRYGAGRGIENFLFAAIGTGLGLGLVLDGKLYLGRSGNGGEIGYIPFPPGSAATLEDSLSGKGIARKHLEAGGSGNPEDAFDEANANLEPGATVILTFLEGLAWTVSALANTLEPEVVVLGGGIGMRCQPFLPKLHNLVISQSSIVPDIVLSELGDEAGLHGALAVAIQESEPLLVRRIGGEGVRKAFKTKALSTKS